jgi:hypothetical protein
MSEANYNKQSCEMIRVASAEAVEDGAIGSFFIETFENGQRVMWHKLPDGNAGLLVLRPIVARANESRPSWEWDGNADKPTLKPSVHLPGRWHGWFKNGRMESVK